jgi:hypothetical protein
MKIVLTFFSGTKFSKKHIIEKFPCFVGRTIENDIQVDHETISKKHFKIDLIKEQLVISDLSSTNGLFLNGQKVSEINSLSGSLKFLAGDVGCTIQIVSEMDFDKTREIKYQIPSNQSFVYFSNPFLGTIISFISIFLFTYLNHYFYQYSHWTQLLIDTLLNLFLVSAIVGPVSLFSKLIVKSFDFFRLLTFSSLLMFFHMSGKICIDLSLYIFEANWPIDRILMFVSLWIGLYLVSSQFFNKTRKITLKVNTAILTIVLYSTLVLISYFGGQQIDGIHNTKKLIYPIVDLTDRQTSNDLASKMTQTLNKIKLNPQNQKSINEKQN